MKKYLTLFLLFSTFAATAQVDRKEVREGNREYKRAKWDNAYLSYRKALERDSTSTAAIYNLSNTLFKKGSSDEAEKRLTPLLEQELEHNLTAPIHYNLGNYLLDRKEYQQAIEHYKSSLRVNPSDIEAKSNLAYAQKMLKDQEQNQDQDKNQKPEDDQDRDQNPEQQPEDKPNPNEPEKDKSEQEQSDPSKISPQAAQQLLQAIRAKEQETREKVEREKAKVLESRKREKNW